MTSSARFIAALTLAATLLTTAGAWAQAAPRRVVVVSVTGTPEDSAALEATLRELLGRLSLVMATESAPASSTLETVTIDLTGTFGAKVLVKSASGATVLDRTIARGDSVAIQREQIAHAVRGAAEAELLVDADRVAGRAPPVVDAAAPAPPPPPAPEPKPEPPPVTVTPPAPVMTAETPIAPAPRSASPLALELSTYAGGGMFASQSSLVARVGGGLTLASRRGLRPQISVLGLYSFPFEAGDDRLGSRTSLVSLRVMPGLGLVQAERFGLDVALGGGVDVMSVEPTSRVLPQSAFGRTTTRVSPLFSGAVTGRFNLATDVTITLSAMLDLDPSSRRYVFDDGPTRSEVLSPWSVRPMLLAGLSFTALGSGR